MTIATLSHTVGPPLGEGCEVWKWRRRLWVLEVEKLRECSAMLNYIILIDDANDMWMWNLHSSKNYTHSNGYNILQQINT